ncbi:MAG: SecDF P1 head subdomain-containing protein, partial [Pseudomonadales bacterium]
MILFVLSFGALYALPNIYRADHAIQISGASSSTEMTGQNLSKVLAALEEADIPVKGEGELDPKKMLIRLQSDQDQLRAQAVLKRTLRDDFVVALNLAPTTPDWLRSIGANPMKLGLDLSGGVHFLLEVDTDVAQKTRMTLYYSDMKRALRKAKILGRVTQTGSDGLTLSFKSEQLRDQARSLISKDNAFSSLTRTTSEKKDQYLVNLTLTESERKEIRDYAVNQNLTTLRNRVNELGVAEPLVVKQGADRIVVELPGVQDTAEAKRILGKTANLEFRLEAKADASMASKEEFEFRNQQRGELRAYLEREIVVTGERVTNAQASFDENGQPQVNITLDSQGGALMHRATRNNVKRRLGVLFVERKTRSVYNDAGELIRTDKYDEKKIISLATIQSALGSQFRTTGLESTAASSEFA